MSKKTKEGALTRKVEKAAAEANSAEAALQGLSGDVSFAEVRLYREIERLAEYIRSAKREIATLRPEDIRSRDIPMATDELDAVIGATADATGAILDAAETLERMAVTMPEGDKVREIATRIYEACNFQDITGQRITKVVRTLKHIEDKIDALLSAFGDGAKGAAPTAEGTLPSNDDRRLLHGPQLPEEANRQDEIDAIFANTK
ncbi:MAG TPA: protein phosphatase CheZ [Stellaceae bacterium]|nr:protein phosphatase CheZ [Stellaceae bacterium]